MDVEKLKAELRRDEGFVPHVYEDSEGFATIGIGRMVDKRRGGGVTLDEAQYLLENDIGKALKAAREAFPWFDDLSDNRQRAITNMVFQMGIGRLRGFRKMLAAIEDGNFDLAAAEAKDSKWYRQTPERAERVIALIREG